MDNYHLECLQSILKKSPHVTSIGSLLTTVYSVILTKLALETLETIALQDLPPNVSSWR